MWLREAAHKPAPSWRPGGVLLSNAVFMAVSLSCSLPMTLGACQAIASLVTLHLMTHFWSTLSQWFSTFLTL